jgi:peptidoglycan/LPS O-acetylase OafA/YrhL
VLPLAVSQGGPELAGGDPLFHILFFIYGFLLMSDPRFGETIDRKRVLLLVLGPVIFAVLLLLVYTEILPEDLPGWVEKTLDVYTESFVPWFLILTLLAYGRRLLNCTNRFLKYFAEAAYPLYILHQTAIIVIAYYVVQWDVAVGVKFALIVLATFASTVAIYDVVVRRNKVTRFLFGMRPLAKK